MNILACADATGDRLAFWRSIEDIAIQQVTEPEAIPRQFAPGHAPDVVIVRIPAITDGFDLLARVRKNSDLPIVAWVPEAGPQDAFYLYSLGADALVLDDATIEERERALRLAVSMRSSVNEDFSREPWRGHLVGNGSSMRVVCELIRLLSQRRCTVLITGETGTGKEMVARALHAASPRASQPMVSLNCNAIPGDLLEAELFGHVKGAYTGAIQGRIGRFEQANRGTLFLDEIGDLPFPLQAKLLRVLQEREVHRLGSSETVKVDVRVIAATNANLPKLIEQGKFRQDLYYRLHVAPIHLPPLRERLEDIPQLVTHLVEKICRLEQMPAKSVPPEIVEWLQSMPWPGNIRELENTLESAIAVNGERPALRAVDFPALMGGRSQGAQLFAMPSEGIDYNAVVGQFERTLLTEALRQAGGSKKRAATLLQLKRTTFAAKLDALRIGKEQGVVDDDSVDLIEQAC